MQLVNVDALKPTMHTERALFDPFSAEQLFAVGAPISQHAIQGMVRFGFRKLIGADPNENAAAIRRAILFRKLHIFSIKPGTIAASDIFTSKGDFLLAEGTVLSDSILSSLARRKITEVYTQRSISAEQRDRVEALRTYLRGTPSATAPRKDLELIEDPEHLSPGVIARISREMTESGSMSVPIDPDNALINDIYDTDPFLTRSEETKNEFVNQYRTLVEETQSVFELLRASQKVNGRQLIQMCEQLIHALIEDRELLLNSIFLAMENGGDYLARHSMNVAIISVNIAAAHGFSRPMIMEVAYGALLADIGMLNVPDEVRFKTTPLSLSDINEIKRHTVYGIDKLQGISELPKTTALIAYQSHERLDGSGYPHGKKATAIHDFAKVVAVADIYHAMIDQRPFRKDPNLPYAAMENLLKMVSQKKLDGRFVKSLLACISLFPVGSWVRLNSGEVARVVKADRDIYTQPVVVILYDIKGQPCDPKTVDLRKDRVRKIQEAVKPVSDNPMEGF